MLLLRLLLLLLLMLMRVAAMAAHAAGRHRGGAWPAVTQCGLEGEEVR